ncbi:hypothetical protein [Gracilimonas sp.]|uniref:hypothetical protein n=1 Tax=Gracilimonas sp. TaxID=1974203 RepID=UPI002870C55D|nr:hypothetical protein [Gracilimonas sp.]
MATKQKEKKLNIIKYITDSNDSEFINAIHDSIEQAANNEDFWETLSENQKSKIEEGLKDIRESRVTDHEKVKTKYGF